MDSYARGVPRPPRSFVPHGVYHVTARGNRRQEIFLAEGDWIRFLNLLGRVAGEHRWSCLSYCLMPNHYHLVMETPNADLSAGMHRLNGRYARWFNERHGFNGHVFQSRFYAVLVESDAHLLELGRYLPLNPVRARLCRHPSAWPWSSYRALAGASRPPAFLHVDRLLGHFGADLERARRAFRLFVRDAVTGSLGPVLVPGTKTRPD